MDVFSPKIIDWATRSSMHKELVLGAFTRSNKNTSPERLNHPLDEGNQYGRDDWQRFCCGNGLEPSMSRRGNCRDDSVLESVFGSLK